MFSKTEFPRPIQGSGDENGWPEEKRTLGTRLHQLHNRYFRFQSLSFFDWTNANHYVGMPPKVIPL